MNLTRKFDIEYFRAVREAAVCSRYLAGADGERNGGAGHADHQSASARPGTRTKNRRQPLRKPGKSWEFLGFPRIFQGFYQDRTS